MAKPLRYGPTIGVRLPLELHDQLASSNGIDELGPTIRDIVVEHYATRNALVDRIVDGLDTGEVASNHPDICTHPKPVAIGGGLKRCDTCGTTTNLKGQWPTP